jgi:hypothetical protein
MGDPFLDVAEALERCTRLSEEQARRAAPGISAALKRTAAAGTSPSGESWPSTKEGGKALAGAAAAIVVEQRGRRVTARIGPPYVFHNYGAGGSSQTKDAKRRRAFGARQRAKSAAAGESVAKSKFHAPQRQIIPGAGDPMPKGVEDAADRAGREAFLALLGGRS